MPFDQDNEDKRPKKVDDNRREEYERFKKHFEQEDVQNRILEISSDVIDKMHANTTRIGQRGETIEGDEWLDKVKLAGPLIHRQGWLARFELLNAKIYGHGCPMFVKELVKEGVVTLEAGGNDITSKAGQKVWQKEVVFLRKGETKARIKQLANRAWGNMDMNLSEFASLGDGGPDTGAAQSHAKLNRMARLGLTLVTPYEAKSGGYNVIAGPVATAFYEQIYLALSDHFEPMIPAKFQEDE